MLGESPHSGSSEFQTVRSKPEATNREVSTVSVIGLTELDEIVGPGHVECQHQGRGGWGWCGFGPKALGVSRWGRFVRASSRWRASSLIPCSL
jgi:hypothetical protein